MGPYGKSIANLYRYAEISKAANRRFLDAMQDIVPAGSIEKEINGICSPKTVNGKIHTGYNVWHPETFRLFEEISSGKYLIRGFTNQDIYSMFLQGMTPCGIAKQLTADGIKSPGGKDKWSQSTVKSILQNEKYKGDALLQKTFTTDFLTKKQKINEGEVPQFYVENSHEAIVDPAVFDMVQRCLAITRRHTLYILSCISPPVLYWRWAAECCFHKKER